MTEADILRKTMTDRVDITREVWYRGSKTTEQVYSALPCALSRGFHNSTPRIGGEWEPVAESRYTLVLFLPAGTIILPGDRAAVTREGQIIRGICSDSFPYPSHAMVNLEVQEVKPV